MTALLTPRADAIAWARSIVADDLSVFLDTETTGLGSDAEIVDIAIVALDGEVLLDTLVRPSRPIPAAATAVHGITDADVTDAPAWSDLGPLVAEFVACRTTVTYNVSFDLAMVNQNNRMHGVPEIERPWQCAMTAYADYAGVPGREPGSMKWHKLADAAAHFGIRPGGHRALGDAEACRQLVFAMAASSCEEMS